MQLTWLHVHSKTYYTDSNKEASKQFFICSTLIWPVIMTKVIPQCTLCLNSCQQQHGFKSQIKSHQIAKSLIKKYFSNCQACTMTKTSIFNVTKSCQNSTSYSHLFSYRQTQWASPGASRVWSGLVQEPPDCRVWSGPVQEPPDCRVWSPTAIKLSRDGMQCQWQLFIYEHENRPVTISILDKQQCSVIHKTDACSGWSQPHYCLTSHG